MRGVGGLPLARRHPLVAGRTAANWQRRIWRGVVGAVWLGARKLRAWRHDAAAQQARANQLHSNDRAIGAASATHLECHSHCRRSRQGASIGAIWRLWRSWQRVGLTIPRSRVRSSLAAFRPHATVWRLIAPRKQQPALRRSCAQDSAQLAQRGRWRVARCHQAAGSCTATLGRLKCACNAPRGARTPDREVNSL